MLNYLPVLCLVLIIFIVFTGAPFVLRRLDGEASDILTPPTTLHMPTTNVFAFCLGLRVRFGRGKGSCSRSGKTMPKSKPELDSISWKRLDRRWARAKEILLCSLALLGVLLGALL